MANGETGDVAIDHYHRYREDFKLLSSLGIDTYRMSIAWPRVMPDTENLNSEGIAFYHRIFDELRKYGIEPFVTVRSCVRTVGRWVARTRLAPGPAHGTELAAALPASIRAPRLSFITGTFRSSSRTKAGGATKA